MVKLSELLFVLAIIVSVNASAILRRDGASPKNGLSVAIESTKVFCTFLPPKPNQNIGDSEDTAVPYCTKKTPNAPGAKLFEKGYILSAHIKRKHKYVQITGRMDPAAGGLNPNDGGGQYDSVGAPPGAVCTGYKKFVNIIEPDEGIYCIRCCTNKVDCDTGHSTDGCRKVIPGDYS